MARNFLLDHDAVREFAFLHEARICEHMAKVSDKGAWRNDHVKRWIRTGGIPFTYWPRLALYGPTDGLDGLLRMHGITEPGVRRALTQLEGLRPQAGIAVVAGELSRALGEKVSDKAIFKWRSRNHMPRRAVTPLYTALRARGVDVTMAELLDSEVIPYGETQAG